MRGFFNEDALPSTACVSAFQTSSPLAFDGSVTISEVGGFDRPENARGEDGRKSSGFLGAGGRAVVGGLRTGRAEAGARSSGANHPTSHRFMERGGPTPSAATQPHRNAVAIGAGLDRRRPRWHCGSEDRLPV